ncbi:MAG: hypothetical protein MUC56_17900 [Thermoanaerobaculales bacterium]|jgi:hypothetical protein|nr:hypothetical protein [Thermoanaerobaculales bacterium]
MGKAKIFVSVVVLVLAGQAASADDLRGSNRFLCAAIQATACVEDGECGIDLPWNLNIPGFIEVDLEAKRISTTRASGENRATPIEHVIREEGVIVFHGFEMGRAFSWVISEQTGRATVAVATDGAAVAVFGACTPMAEAAGSAGR